MAVHKTNAVRVLERMEIHFELRPYEVDPDDLSAETVAAKIGHPPEKVFKTLIVKGERRGVCLAVIPGPTQLDLKALAKVTNDKKVDTVPLRDVQALTGYVRGGVTALACKKPYPVFLDASSLQHNLIAVSAGIRGLQILLSPHDYVSATSATVAPIACVKGHTAQNPGAETE